MEMKNIKKPAYAVKLGIGVFFADDICPVCGRDAVYFDAGNGWYECPYCDWHSKRVY